MIVFSKKMLTLVAAAAVITSCSIPRPSPSELTGHVGCPASEISIKNFSSLKGNKVADYEVYCRNKKYYCSTSRQGPQGGIYAISCSKG